MKIRRLQAEQRFGAVLTTETALLEPTEGGRALFLGGSGSGKSAAAETLMADCRRLWPARPAYYWATLKVGTDPENQARVAKHRQARAALGLETVEGAEAAVTESFPDGSLILLEDLGNLLAEFCFGSSGPGYEALIAAEQPERLPAFTALLAALRRLAERSFYLIVVGNDVFAQPTSSDPATRAYLRLLAHTQRSVAAWPRTACLEVVAGIPMAWPAAETSADDVHADDVTADDVNVDDVTAAAAIATKTFADDTPLGGEVPRA